tara:strand:+ start:983 stop:1267 length:285 start_codon:yes stop_codon:yes gene_type:complete
MSDKINPEYYTSKKIETIQAIRSQIGDDFEGYCRGNIMKYICRYGAKGGSIRRAKREDVEKLIKYATWLKEFLSEEGTTTVGDIDFSMFTNGKK